MPYEVYLYNVPKVSDDGKEAIPVPPSQTKGFENLEDAKKYAAEHKDKFDRVVVIESGEGGQKMVDRFMDGQPAMPEPQPEPTATAS